MLDGVLDQRLDADGGDLLAADGRVDVDLDAQALAEAGLLDAEVGGDELHLLVEAGPLALGLAESVAEDLGEALDGLLGEGGLVVDRGRRWRSAR